jgi:hypothetical protein
VIACANFSPLGSWGEEQQLIFVVLPQPKKVGAKLDSTQCIRKIGEEQQQTPQQLLFSTAKNGSQRSAHSFADYKQLYNAKFKKSI